MKNFASLLEMNDELLTNELVFDTVQEVLEDFDSDLSDEEDQLLTAFAFLLDRGPEFDQKSLSYILSVINVLYVGEEDEDDYDYEEENSLNEEIVRKVRRGKRVAYRPGYRKVGNKYQRIKPSTRRKQSRKAKRFHQAHNVKRSSINKAKRSRKKTYSRHGSFIKHQSKK